MARLRAQLDRARPALGAANPAGVTARVAMVPSMAIPENRPASLSVSVILSFHLDARATQSRYLPRFFTYSASTSPELFLSPLMLSVIPLCATPIMSPTVVAISSAGRIS